MSFRDVTIARYEEQSDRVRMTSRTGSARRSLGDFEESCRVEARRRTRWSTFAGTPKPGEFARYGRRTRSGQDDKDSMKRLCLSPYVETFNSKIIKAFVPEQRSRYVFSNFEIPTFYVYMLPTFDVHFAHGRIWLWYRAIHEKE